MPNWAGFGGVKKEIKTHLEDRTWDCSNFSAEATRSCVCRSKEPQGYGQHGRRVLGINAT